MALSSPSSRRSPAPVDHNRVVVPILSIEEFVAGLERLPSSAFDEPAPLLDYLQQFPPSLASLHPYLSWNSRRYTRNRIERTPIYELLALCWEPGQASAIHGHDTQHGWFAVLEGSLAIEDYDVKWEDISAGQCAIEATTRYEQVPSHSAFEARDAVHRVHNPTKRRAVSLHLYSRPIDRCVVYGNDGRSCGIVELGCDTEYGVARGRQRL